MRPFIVLCALLTTSAVEAQQTESRTESRTERFMRDCDRYDDRDLDNFCEVREVKMPVGQRLTAERSASHLTGRATGAIADGMSATK
jgi:hypothetical protein